MTKEFPNDSMINLPVKLLFRASGFFRHYSLGISHSTASLIGDEWPPDRHLIPLKMSGT
jgi:hypothetical protein